MDNYAAYFGSAVFACAIVFAQMIDQACCMKLEESFVTVKIFGNTTLGYYYVNLNIGDPPQRQSMVLDTGSY